MFDTKWISQTRTPHTWKGALAGFVGGLAASWVMSRFQAAVPASTFKALLGEEDGEENSSSDEAEPATVQAAKAVSEHVLGHEPSDDEKDWAGPAVHYAQGSFSAALYGGLVEHEPAASAGAGLPFGVALWLVADEGAVPALGLSKPPWTFPASTHAYSLASHLVYGLSADIVRRLVRRVL